MTNQEAIDYLLDPKGMPVMWTYTDRAHNDTRKKFTELLQLYAILWVRSED